MKAIVQVTQPFGCYRCGKVIEAKPEKPAVVEATVTNWTGWANPFGPPDKWDEVDFRCEPSHSSPGVFFLRVHGLTRSTHAEIRYTHTWKSVNLAWAVRISGDGGQEGRHLAKKKYLTGTADFAAGQNEKTVTGSGWPVRCADLHAFVCQISA